jgi:hypothetical protein
MKSYRYYLNTIVVWDILFTFLLEIVLQPFPIPPAFIANIKGFAYYLGYQCIYAAESLNTVLLSFIFKK